MASAVATRAVAADPEHKARLGVLLSDMYQMGVLRGFLCFSLSMRGGEEMLITIRHEPLALTPVASPPHSFSSESGRGLQRGLLPRNQDSLMLSGRTQRRLSGYGYINIGLPPASPSEHETAVPDEHSTMFLVAAYAKYCCPYVWVRSNHDRLIRLSGAEQSERDNPLKLKTTVEWATGHVTIWDIVAELVNICSMPQPINPFAIDNTYFEQLGLEELMMASGAMAAFLQRVLMQSRGARYESRMQDDLNEMLRLHFSALKMLFNEEAEPRIGTELPFQPPQELPDEDPQ